MIPVPETLGEIAKAIIEHEYNSPEVMELRKTTCFACQYYISETMKCSECNCPVVMMAQFNFKQCPKGYWE